LNAFNAELRRYIEADPGPVHYRTEVQRDPPAVLLIVDAIAPPPPVLGVLLGELVHNLRSSLDHLVWQLALLDREEPFPLLQYPIVSKPEDWLSKAKQQLKDVRAGAVELIEQTQPYHWPHSTKYGEHPLAVLRDLSNEDKHRVILSTVMAVAEPKREWITIQHNEDAAPNFGVEFTYDKRLEIGSRLATINFTPIGPKPSLDVQYAPHITAGVGSMDFRVDALPGLCAEVRRTIIGFRDFFPTADWPFKD
jgi:hypothetical protein